MGFPSQSLCVLVGFSCFPQEEVALQHINSLGDGDSLPSLFRIFKNLKADVTTQTQYC